MSSVVETVAYLSAVLCVALLYLFLVSVILFLPVLLLCVIL